MSENKQYEKEYKVQAVKLAKKTGVANAAKELQIPVNTLYGWIRKAKSGSLEATPHNCKAVKNMV